MAFDMALLSLLILGILPYISAQRISTTNGDIVGTRSTVSGKSVDTYYGIPFAKPPVGDLRFKHPVAADSWRPELKNTTERKAACYQVVSGDYGMPWRKPYQSMSEDCLYINAWVPTTLPGDQKLSTMVWIYGGSFNSGSINDALYDGRYLAAEQNVIVVSINYRLGAHGFLYLSPDTFPGNQGMMDQVLAMKWIYENVESFGGDRNSITLFGQSAGAACVGHHLLSPLSRTLFNRAILESGSPNADWAAFPLDVAESAARELATMAGCSASSKADIQMCVQNIDPTIILQKQQEIESVKSLQFVPIVDGYFLPDFPINLLLKGQMKQVDILLGTNKDEGTLFLVGMFPTVFLPLPTITVTKQQFDQTVIQGLVTGKAAPAKNAIYAQYVDTKLVADRDYIKISGDMFGDSLFVCPVISFADVFAKGNQSSVFLYSFEHRLSALLFPPWMGTTHSFELEFVFGKLLGNTLTGSSEEVQLSRQIMSYWAQFAKTGNPNVIGQSGLAWPQYDLDTEKYLTLDLPGKMAVSQGLKKQECVFWNSIVPIILKKKADTPDGPHGCTISSSYKRNPAVTITVLLSMLSVLYTCW